jgi:hypothetical protein
MQNIRKHEGSVLVQTYEGNNVVLTVQCADSVAQYFN